MDSRADRISRAKEIIKANPSWGKDRIAGALKAEFGMALDHNKIVALRKEAAPRTQETRRYATLVKEGFLASEAQVLARRPITTDDMERYRAKRRSVTKKYEKAETPKKERAAQIRNLYALDGHAPRGRISPKVRFQEFAETYKPPVRVPRKEREDLRRQEAAQEELAAMLIKWGFSEEEAAELSLTLGASEIVKGLKGKGREATMNPWREAMAWRMEWIAALREKGWSYEKIRKAIEEYRRKPGRSPWDFIRKEYKPKLKVQDFGSARRRRAEALAKVKTLPGASYIT